MATLDAQLIQTVVSEVMNRLNGTTQSNQSLQTEDASLGHFTTVDEAVDVAARSQQQLVKAGLVIRGDICDLIKKLANKNAENWGRFELEETKVGRLVHKIDKLKLVSDVPATEFLKTIAHSGDEGIGLDEAAPWGIIGVITPVTHSIPTMLANAINMIAAGNSMIVNAHPSGAKSAAIAAAAINKAVYDEYQIEPLVCVINPPTLRTAEEVFQHPRIPMLVATGGPAVARAAMKQPKRAIVAGPGNPPVVIDETADLNNAAKSIIAGAAFDNNLLCIGEKEVFVVDSVFDPMMKAMEKNGALRLNNKEIDTLTKVAFNWVKDHHAVTKECVGKDPQILGKLAGFNVPPSVELLFGETLEDSPFVCEEQMMPFVPFVRVRDFEQALQLAVKHEHGFGHTAIIHSNNLQRITRMGRVMNTTIFVANGPCTAGLGVGGEGYPSYSIATPTGEGITNPLTFTRFRRFSVSNALRIV
ncbi:Succinate-semialdehyde dehydrogenase (acetylating) [Poriferisphaera corsica]|uniref:Succinate-semialdehyde dehydrogenase (Acetylating) n=1 Tax=Poriferisphaera corsica TaxID=2528020 RepID=A0A517YUK5_9BACT|nr:aldehyde dehydrogenase [Poriferisphaera corsica]QDU33906.1 Succinate-semialdehyde dehydrogenase (acetylating) [Poriferisphaera corsica]